MAELEQLPWSSRQLTLGVNLRDEATLDNFCTLNNAVVVDAIAAMAAPDYRGNVFLHGAEGTGKSHLLQALVQARGAHSLYLPLSELATFQPEQVIADIAGCPLICIDDVHRVAGMPAWEEALFHLFNQVQQGEGTLLFAANLAPRHMPLKLEDLRSRLSSAIVYALASATDEDKASLLAFRANRRGMALSDAMAQYIVGRASRDTRSLLATLDTLDRASLVHKRPLSIPFIKSVLGW